ncbi:MAG: HTH domain-containing protein [Parcubacteria group bacterium]|jgi:DNA-directed RNA polymerase specialized sigma subunit
MENTPKTSQNQEGKTSFFDLANNLLSAESGRAQEIVRMRFGLAQVEPQTLEKIGRENKITRERVRQIIGDVLKRLKQKKNEADFKVAEDKIVFTIGNNNGIMEESKLIEKLSSGEYKEANAVALFGALSEKIVIFEKKGEIRKSWAVSKDVLGKVQDVESIAKEIFGKEKKLLTDDEIVEKIGQRLAEKKAAFSREQILNYLAVLADVQKNKFGKWGIAGWKEINPKGTRERIYLILKEKREPLHFTEIAKLIDQYGLSKRKAHPQTVHNELIKDERFILVGRGIYALKEWGYKRGTIQEVLRDILDKSQKSLTKEEILTEVMKLRKVKKATVMINLNNSKIFEKANNAYTIKK